MQCNSSNLNITKNNSLRNIWSIYAHTFIFIIIPQITHKLPHSQIQNYELHSGLKNQKPRNKIQRSNKKLTQINLPTTITMSISFDKLTNFILIQILSKNLLPLPRRLLRQLLYLPNNRSTSTGPFPVKPARSERRKLRGFTKRNGLNRTTGLGIWVPEIKGQVWFHRKRVWNWGFLMGFWGFGLLGFGFCRGFRDWREWWVVVRLG